VKGDEERSLLAHERVHASHGHSYDVLFYEVLAALSWWNPLWRLALRELRTVHELQADAVASTFHPNYGHLLLSRALGVPASTLVNSFRSSNLKTRITMLNKTASRLSTLKYGLALPVLIAALIAVSCVRPDAAPVPTAPPEPPAAPAAPTRSGTSSQPIMDLSEVDIQPEFPGGKDALYAYLRNNTHYPEQALKDKLAGKVYVQFTVDVDGKVKDAVLRRGPRKDLNDEAIRAVASMPNWTPGQKDGHAVATRFIIPVAFTLDKGDAPAKN
jgi:TonB family protein